MSEFARGSILLTYLNHAISEHRLDGQFDEALGKMSLIEQLRAKSKALTVEELAALFCIAVRNSVQGGGGLSCPALSCANVARPVDRGGLPMIAVPTSTSDIDSWLALAPAGGFLAVMERRARLEDEFLSTNLLIYKTDAALVPIGVPSQPGRSEGNS
jgi:hypothetical protein